MSGGTTQRNTSSGSTTGTSYGTSGGTSNGYTSGTNYSSSNPNVPEWAQAAPQNFMQQVGGFGRQLQQNPNMLATPANGLLGQAYSQASQLPDGAAQIGQANGLAMQAATGAPGSYNAANYTASGYQPTSYTAAGYTAPTIAPTAMAQSASLLDGLSNYFNPYEQRVVDTTLADFDVNANRQRGDQLAAAAANGGLSGSRFAIGQGALEGELARARASTDANIRHTGFTTAAGLSSQDADRRQQASMANAAAQNAQAMAQAGLLANAGQFNASANNAASQFGADARNVAGQFNAGANNAAGQFNAGANNAASQFNVANQQAGLDRMLSAAGLLSNNAGLSSSIANNNLASQLAVGNNQYTIDRGNALAQLQGLQAYQGLLDPSVYAQFVGQTNVGSQTGMQEGTQTGYNNENTYGTIQGTEVSKKKDSLLSSLLQMGSRAASAYAGGA